ncbi:MAG: hypothetical protein EZS28_053592, partial [Streblomastix strix]
KSKFDIGLLILSDYAIRQKTQSASSEEQVQ